MSELGDPKDVPQLLLLLAPGFIILWLRSRVVEGRTLDFKEQLFHFALVSAAYYGLVGPLFHSPNGIVLSEWVWRLLFYFALPAALGGVLGYVTQNDLEYRFFDRLNLRLSHRIPTAWDYRFSRLAKGTFVLVTLKDGSSAAGRMAERSFAASSRDGRDIYIQEMWEVPAGGGAWTRAEPARGVIVCGEDIRFVEVYGD